MLESKTLSEMCVAGLSASCRRHNDDCNEPLSLFCKRRTINFDDDDDNDDDDDDDVRVYCGDVHCQHDQPNQVY